MSTSEERFDTDYDDQAMLRYALIAIVLVGFVFYLMLGVQVDTVSAADFSAETQVTWVCPVTPFH